jgi:polysaccharide biosynthesis protein PslH
MRILWVNIAGLWPMNMGGRVRSVHLIAELSQRHRVQVLTTHGVGDDPAGLAARLPACESVESVPAAAPKRGTARFALALARSWVSPDPIDFRKWRIPALRSAVGRSLARGDVDVCVADFLYAIGNIPQPNPVPVILFEHNVQYMIWKRLREVEPIAWRRTLLEIEWRKMRRSEARACQRSDLTIAVSDADRALLAAIAPQARVFAIPTGVDTTYFLPNGSEEAAARLVFTGAMDWYPNEEAILAFIESTLPAIRRAVPQVSLTVAGRNPTARLRTAAAAAGVSVTGTVEDIRPYIADAAVYVVPLRVGGGTRLKIFEALAMGKPVVSTTVGAEGLPLVAGEHFVRADGPAEFAAAVVSLLGDPARRQALGTAGRRLVEQRYSWAQVARVFEHLCLGVRGRETAPR